MFANAAVAPTTASSSSDIGSEKLKIRSTAMDMEAAAKEMSAEKTEIMNDDGAKGTKTESQTDTATMVMTEMKMSYKENDWWQHMVLYQIYPRSFMDTNGDGVGDLQGIIMKLPYLAETGIHAVWLSPIFKSPMVDFGYDITDFKDIHTEYGTMLDVDKLITESNRLGIKIIMDFVPNHTSNQSEWFEKSINREDGFE
ncbi:maltase 2-like, partial [Rhagoletis pomonella]|uniref:maltase 2-like n=1 Tax=Rhagoletis pomonella TaxID=28610 RepID=UPI001784FDFE